MKSLRQLLRRRQPASRTAPSKKRRLSTQALEQRQLLAGDFNVAHNYLNHLDVNQDFELSPSDALGVINFLAAGGSIASGESGSEDPFDGRKVDVNGDGNVSPSDALSVINALARGEGVGEVVELRLTARDLDDTELTEDVNGITQVQEGAENSFLLEVSYEDLRGLQANGVFSIFPDLNTSRGNLIKPVLRESQQVIFSNEIFSTTTGSYFVALETDPTTTVEITRNDFNNGPSSSLADALVQLGGYDPSDLEVTEPSFLRGEDEDNPTFGLQVRYVGADLGNVDVPDLVLTETFDTDVQITFNETAPFLADGVTPNNDAIGLSLDVRSRTRNQEQIYSQLNRGEFDANAGFSDIGGVGPASSSGLARPLDDVDAFAIEVFIDGPIPDNNPLIIDVSPGSGVDPLLVYGSDDPVPNEMILIDEDAIVRLSTGAVGVNNPPIVDGPISQVTNEDAADFSINLLEGASDPDDDTLSVTDFSFTSGDTMGVTQNGTTVDVTPSAYNALAAGETELINATYTISDGNGGTVAQALTLTIEGRNDSPDAGDDLNFVRDEFDAAFSIDLLQNATDPDTSDVLDVINITQVGSDDASGVVANDANNQIDVTPTAYAALNDGESITVTYDFTVVDGNGGQDTARVVVTINGDTPNTPPVAGDPIMVTFTEDDADSSIDLTTNVTDVDTEDTLTVVEASVVVTGDQSGIVRTGNDVSISPAAYNALPVGGMETIVFTYDVSDGEGGTDSHSATITITGANDAPVVAGPVTASISEDDGGTTVDLLEGASDPDTGDSVSLSNLTFVSGDDRGVTTGADSLSIDPSQYNFLSVGESVTAIYSYDVVDTNDAVTPQSATITITGANDAPIIGDPISATVSEDDSSVNIDLLVGSSDPDQNDSLSIDNFTTVSGDSTPFTIVNDETLTFDPNAYNSLAAGETEIVVVNFDIVDGNGGQGSQSATITINGANDAPVVSGPISLTISEQDADQVLSLLDNASDPDTSDTLSVANVNVSGDDEGVQLNGNNLDISPNLYDSLTAGQSAVVTLTYQVTDGTESVNQTATVTITGVDDAPVVDGPLTFTFDERDASTSVDLLAGASDPNNDPINIINAQITSGDARGVFVNLSNSQLEITPSAYEDLEDGEQAVVVVDYQITDDEGNTVDQTATVTITGRTIVGSSVSGTLFIDHIENIEDVRNGADPIRNGVHDEDEDALGGVMVRLYQVVNGVETEVAQTMTGNDGIYSFPEVLGGTYIVEYDVPDSVMFEGSRRGVVNVSDVGDEQLSGPSLGGIGLVGVQHRVELLARYYAQVSQVTDDPTGLGTAQLDENGNQVMFVAGEGFESEFAEVVLNETRDAVLLTMLDGDGNYVTARIGQDFFVVAGDGEGVRFFGDLDDFGFSPFDPDNAALQSEFEAYGNTIDLIMEMGL
ncbi:MAG: cadherin-like domain-containing protein [Planctomycetota bacterium]